MQLVTVLSAAVLLNTAVAVQPATQELVKKDPHRHGRWWRWRHHGKNHGGHDHDHSDEPSWSSGTYTPISSTEVATSTLSDPGNFTSDTYTYTSAPITSSLSSTASYSSVPTIYSYPNSTSTSPSIPASLSSTAPYSFPNSTYTSASIPASLATTAPHSYIPTTYRYPNSTYAVNSSLAGPTAYSTSSAPACSVSDVTSTITVTESITETFTYTPTTSASNYTWTTSALSSSSQTASVTNVTYSVNATSGWNFSTFTASPFYPSSTAASLTTLLSSPLPPSSILSASTILPSSTLEVISIFISANPIFTAAPSAVLHPSTTVSQTTTVTEGQATGTPDAGAFHCGVHGLPIGLYKMAEYWEDRRNVGVTLLGCWEFCEGANDGCFSYSFYHEEGTGAPRCDLFGGSVADSLDSIIKEVPRVWYDLGCGNPLLL